MKKITENDTPVLKKKPKEWRIARTVSFSPEQDRYLAETTGGGNVSEYVRQLVDAAREGRVTFPPAMSGGSSGVDRARAYHRAKEASMSFEEDAYHAIEKGIAERRGLRVVRNRVHNGDGVFVADLSIEDAAGRVLLSVQCKSSPRADRLNLALAEAMIGTQKTGAPVVTAVPYLLPESADVVSRFALMEYRIAKLSELVDVVLPMLRSV